jgi:hypothetical protein
MKLTEEIDFVRHLIISGMAAIVIICSVGIFSLCYVEAEKEKTKQMQIECGKG